MRLTACVVDGNGSDGPFCIGQYESDADARFTVAGPPICPGMPAASDRKSHPLHIENIEVQGIFNRDFCAVSSLPFCIRNHYGKSGGFRMAISRNLSYLTPSFRTFLSPCEIAFF